jgi:hypothetical protein
MLQFRCSRQLGSAECELRRVTNGGRETGFVYVKSGEAPLNSAEHSDLADEGHVFLCSSLGNDGGQQLSVDQK